MRATHAINNIYKLISFLNQLILSNILMFCDANFRGRSCIYSRRNHEVTRLNQLCRNIFSRTLFIV